MIEQKTLYTPLHTPSTGSYSVNDATWELMAGRLWPLVEDALRIRDHEYRSQGSFTVNFLGKIVVSTDSEQDKVILDELRYGETVRGGYGWDTFARICFGYENLIMAEGDKHTRLSQVLGTLFNKTTVRDHYFDELKAVTEKTVSSWAQEKQGIYLLDEALKHSCKTVTTTFLGKEAAESEEIIEAVKNLMGVFFDNAQLKLRALASQVFRKICCCGCVDPEGYYHSHGVLENAIEEARLNAPKGSFAARLRDFSDQEIIDNIKMLYFAGTETTGSAITTLLANLDEKEQELLRKELNDARIYSLDDLSFDKLHSLERLKSALYEALRLVPPIPMQVREVKTDKGQYAYFIDHYHRLRRKNLVGEDPDMFNPDRVLINAELKKEIEKTFGAGKTPCLGKQFALTETLLMAVAMLLQGSFKVIEGNTKEIIKEAGAHLSPNLKIQFHLKND